MSKYKFITIDEDTTQLCYKDKKFNIKRDVELSSEIQGVYAEAKMQMMLDLTKKGLTKKDLTIVKKEGSKTYYDNSNVIEMEQYYTSIKSLEIFDRESQKYIGMGLEQLVEDIGLDETEQNQFGIEFGKALKGEVKTPSEES